MPHTYTLNYTHFVFSTKDLVTSIAVELRPRLYSYIGGIARSKGMKTIAVGGTSDHVHIFVRRPATISESDAMLLIKTNS